MKSGFTKSLRMPLIAAFAFAAFPALAADMYSGGLKGAPAYAVPSVWSGFYLGVNGGYAWGANSSTLTAGAWDFIDGISATPVTKFSTEGGFGGGQLGFNVQRDRVVFGLEADIQGAGINGKGYALANADLGDVTTEAWAQSNLDWFGTFRGRLGYTFGGTLVYATGGLAFGGVRDSLSQLSTTNLAEPALTSTPSASRNTTLTGYAVGGGLEMAVTPSWSVKAEYQYIDLGSTTLLATDSGIDLYHGADPRQFDAGAASVSIGHTYHTARVGLNYKLSPVYEPLK